MNSNTGLNKGMCNKQNLHFMHKKIPGGLGDKVNNEILSKLGKNNINNYLT